MKSSKNNVDDMKQGKGEQEQGELYSPYHSLKINTTPNNNNHIVKNNNNIEDHNNNSKNNMVVGKGVAMEIKSKMSMVKERLMEKLAAASVPSDALENARHYVESVIKDVTSAAQGLTKDALMRIKSHLADILPSLSPSLTSKMVDDSENEATSRETGDDEGEETEQQNDYEQHKGKTYATPASSLFSNYLLKPTSKL